MRQVQMCQVPPGSGLKPVYGTGYPGTVEQLRELADRQKTARQRYERFGDLTFTRFFGRDFVTVMSPSAAETVIMNRRKDFANEPAWDFLIGVAFKRGILLMDFEEHRQHRSILQQAFTTANLAGYLQKMQPVIAERFERFPVGKVRMAHDFKATTLDMALEVFVGVELPRGEADRLNQAFIDCIGGLTALVRRPILGGKWRRAVAGRRVLEDFFRQQLPAKRARHTQDLFSVLCHAESEEGHTFTDDDVVNHMIFVLFAAHDTSTTALTTIAYELARHPDWQQRVREQSLAAGAEISYDSLATLTELDLVMKESLRINPPVPTLVREALVDTDIDGHYIPGGTLVAVNPHAIHHNPTVWAQSHHFDPERFAPDRREHKVHRFAWMPFGGGVHKCIGLYFAQLEIKTIMHHLLRNYEWSVPPDYRWAVDPRTLAMPRDGLRAEVRRI